MSKPPIEGGEDRYPEGSEYYQYYKEGREARMEGDGASDNPYQHQPHQKKFAAAWEAGWYDEHIWALDYTGR